MVRGDLAIWFLRRLAGLQLLQPLQAPERPLGQPKAEIGREPREDGIGQEVCAGYHADQRKKGAEGNADQEPAAADGRRAQPPEGHDESGGGDMAADE